MPRPALGPRLYLDPGRNQWIIRDGVKFKRTGIAANDEDRARKALSQHIRFNRPDRTIYFITCLFEGFPVKIGRTIDLNERMRDLQTAMPYRPVLLASFAGKLTDEAALHKRFADLRLLGEWFRREPVLMDYISSLPTVEALPPVKVPEFPVAQALAFRRVQS